MKLCILYHPKSEFGTPTEQFAEECKKQTTQSVELISLETQEGASMARLYDMVSYPAILIIREDGELIKDWQGPQFPLISEVIGNLNT